MIKQELSSKPCPSLAVMIHDDLTADDGHRLAQKLLYIPLSRVLNILWCFNLIPYFKVTRMKEHFLTIDFDESAGPVDSSWLQIKTMKHV